MNSKTINLIKKSRIRISKLQEKQDKIFNKILSKISIEDAEKIHEDVLFGYLYNDFRVEEFEKELEEL